MVPSRTLCLGRSGAGPEGKSGFRGEPWRTLPFLVQYYVLSVVSIYQSQAYEKTLFKGFDPKVSKTGYDIIRFPPISCKLNQHLRLHTSTVQHCRSCWLLPPSWAGTPMKYVNQSAAIKRTFLGVNANNLANNFGSTWVCVKVGQHRTCYVFILFPAFKSPFGGMQLVPVW